MGKFIPWSSQPLEAIHVTFRWNVTSPAGKKLNRKQRVLEGTGGLFRDIGRTG